MWIGAFLSSNQSPAKSVVTRIPVFDIHYEPTLWKIKASKSHLWLAISAYTLFNYVVS
jgi:hypothetical protein